MSISKKKAFNEKMSLKKMYPNHLVLANGGRVKRKKFADGGSTASVPSNPVESVLPSGSVGAVQNASNPAATGPLGAIGGVLGLNNTFQANGANIQQGTNSGQLSTAYSGANNAINAQTGLVNNLQPQVPGAVANQNALAAQYLAMTKGQGPNPAQAALNQATQQNINNQAALMAGQRGAGANVGLIARQAAQQGAATQQNAVGQSATLQAEQQIAAQNNLANLTNNQVSQAGQAVSGLNTAQQGEQAILQNANTSANNAAVGMQSNINNVNQQTAAQNAKSNNSILGDIAGGAAAIFGFADGGQVPHPNLGVVHPGETTASGLNVEATPNHPTNDSSFSDSFGSSKDFVGGIKNKAQIGSMESSDLGSMGEMGAAEGAEFMALAHGGQIPVPHSMHFHNYFKGGETGVKVPALVSPKEVYLSPDKVKKVINEGADPMKIGHRFPGKDAIKGKNSFKNDKIPVTLEEGGCVVPVSVTTHRKAPQKSRDFVLRHMRKPGGQ